MDAVIARSPPLLSPSCPANLLPPRVLLLSLRIPSPSSSNRRPVASQHGRSGAVSAVPTGSAVILSKNNAYTVGDFMTRKEDLLIVKLNTTIDEALEMLVENRITGFPVVDDDWKLVGLVSDYDLLALDSISGGGLSENNMFPEVDSTWKRKPYMETDAGKSAIVNGGYCFDGGKETACKMTFNEVQKLLSKTNGQVVGDVMTPAPVVVRETTNLEDAARVLLETKYRRLPVVDARGKLVGIITRGNVVRAALQIKRESERDA